MTKLLTIEEVAERLRVVVVRTPRPWSDAKRDRVVQLLLRALDNAEHSGRG